MINVYGPFITAIIAAVIICLWGRNYFGGCTTKFCSFIITNGCVYVSSIIGLTGRAFKFPWGFVHRLSFLHNDRHQRMAGEECRCQGANYRHSAAWDC